MVHSNYLVLHVIEVLEPENSYIQRFLALRFTNRIHLVELFTEDLPILVQVKFNSVNYGN